MSDVQEAQRGTQELMEAGGQQDLQSGDAAGAPAPAADMLASTAGAVQVRWILMHSCKWRVPQKYCTYRLLQEITSG
jgi:hypothetical protein